MDWEAEGLLDGLEGEAREARIRLLDELAADGVSREVFWRDLAALRRAMESMNRLLLAAAAAA